MSKRSSLGEVTAEDRTKPAKVSKPSLDSDEEDYQNEEEYFRLREKDIEGQENPTIEYDEDTKITPFNMREELEEDGHFDGSGNFIFKKSTDARDNWLEDIDWVEVNRSRNTAKSTNTAISDEPVEPLEHAQKMDLYQQLLKYMKPKESVLRSIKRMGAHSASSRSASASQRWLKKKTKTVNTSTEANGDPDGLIRLTEVADQLLQSGEFDVYQSTYESIERLLENKKHPNEPEDELDALGKALDDENEDENVQADHTNDATVMWHVKRPNVNENLIEGPYTTAQIREMVDTGKFSDDPTVLVRQTDRPNGPFYSIQRIDFDLYE